MERNTREQWQDRIERWRASGLGAQEFAEQEGVTAKSLHNWSYRLKGGRSRRMRNTAVPMVEVTPSQMVLCQTRAPAARAKVEPFEVNFRSGLRIVVPADFDGGAFERLLVTLGAS